jgi:hypothetical protein
MSKIYRQGDILLLPVAALPELRAAVAQNLSDVVAASTKVSLLPVAAEHGRLILAHGEVTGHHHSFALAHNVALFREDGSGGGLFLSVTGAPADLEHQEHSTIVVPPGEYAVVRQREYSPEAIRRVED